DFAVTFTASSATLGSSTSTKGITVNVKATGDVWVSTDVGLFHTVNNGTTFTQITGFTNTYSLSTGAPKTTGGYPSVFAFGTYNGTPGLWRSDDQGSTWTRLDDAAHGFGSQEANYVCGDQRAWGRLYVGTNGRGIFYGDDNGSTSTTTTKASSTTTSSSSTRTSSSSTTTSKTSSITTTTKTSSSTTTTTTTTTAGGTGTACHYCQCGGTGFTGPTTCVSPYTCTYSNDFYSQCL
ncbi:carbohydrate-binding module family 1 protein, partial [Tulasnella calospora MUT 4182]